MAKSPKLSTYRTAADYLEKRNGAGWRLLGWTVLRAGVISVPFLLVKTEPKKAIAGSVLASALITAYVVTRIGAAKR